MQLLKNHLELVKYISLNQASHVVRGFTQDLNLDKIALPLSWVIFVLILNFSVCFSV